MSLRRISSCFLLLAGAFFDVGRASADPLPVIAVNREIGVAALGSFTGVSHRYGSLYSSTSTSSFYGQPPYNSVYNSNYYSRSRENAWVPGFEATAQAMFDLGRIRHLYVSGTFDLGSGRNHAQEDYLHLNNVFSSYSGRYQTTVLRGFTNSWGEIGKGFLLAHDRLLLTPTVQGGYATYGYGGDLTDGRAGYVGLALHADYALTNRLVLRGRAGWAQFLETHEYFSDRNGGPPHGSTSPQFQGDVGLDYRLTSHLHLTGGARYTYLDYGKAHASYSENTSYPFFSYKETSTTQQNAASWTNGVNLRLGIAYGF